MRTATIITIALLLAAIAVPAFADGDALKCFTSGITLGKNGQWTEAIKQFDEAIRIDPKYATAWHARGVCFAELKRYKEALVNYDQSILLDPSQKSTFVDRGTVQWRSGNYDAARKDYEQALKIDPKDADARARLDDLNKKHPAAEAKQRSSLLAGIDKVNKSFDELKNQIDDAKKSLDKNSSSATSDTAPEDVIETPATANHKSNSKDMPEATKAPWAPESSESMTIPRTAPAIPVAPLLNINEITTATYNGSVSAAMEAMRLIYGNLTAQQEADFQKRWNPLFDNPTPESVDYLNKLNPLLSQFLAIRAAITEAATQFDSARLEMITAAGLKDEAGTREALDVGYNHEKTLESLRTSLADVVEKITALGNPPSPVEGHKRRRKAHADAVDYFKHFAPAKPTSTAGGSKGLYWVLKSLDTGGAKTPDNDSTRNTFQSVEGQASGSTHMAGKDEQYSVAGTVKWTPPAHVMKELELPDEVSAQYTQFSADPPMENFVNALENACGVGYMVGNSPNRIDGAYWGYAAKRDKPVSRNRTPSKLLPYTGCSQSKTGISTAQFAVTIRTPGGSAWYTYVYEQRELTASQVQSIKDAEKKAKQDLGKQQAEAADKQRAEQEEAALQVSAIANVQANIKYFQERATDLRSKLASADPSSREKLDWMRMVADSNLQGEKDQLTSIQTGEYVHTRTEFDDYCLSGMIENIRQEVAKLDTDQRKIVNYPRLIALLPKEMQYDERQKTDAMIQKAIESGDFAKVDMIVKNLSDRVQGYWQTESAKQEEKATYANLGLDIAQNIKSSADYTMMGLSMFGGSGVYALYQGTTGYIDGGPVEAVKQAAGALSMTVSAACSVYDGYKQGGIEGAGYAAAGQLAVLFVMHKIAAPLAASLQTGGGPVRKWPTVEQMINEKRFKAQYAEGRSLISVFQKRQAKLAAAGQKGASNDVILKLRGEAEQAAMAIKSSYTAKMLLNQAAREGDTKLMHAYMSHEKQFMGRVRESFENKMTSDGWSKQQYKEFRNASSVGKAGMDLDLGAIEPKRWTTGPNGENVPNPEYLNWRRNLTQSGETRTLRELQEAGQKNLEDAYKSVLGRSPSEAFINFTTSGHPEAYKDLAWLGKKQFKIVDIPNMDPAWARQAADVTGFKVMDLNRSHPTTNYYIKLQEQCRGMVKDFDTKLGPLMKPARPEIKSHWSEIRQVMSDFSTNKIGPVDADRKLRSLTGGEGIGEVQKQFSDTLESLVKFGKASTGKSSAKRK